MDGGFAMTPIETRYKGFRFRCRTEARWAVFLDSIAAEWEYEREGFKLPTGPYLPDFFVRISRDDTAMRAEYPDAGYWLEVKGETPTDRELRLLDELAKRTGHGAILVAGQPGTEAVWFAHRLFPIGARPMGQAPWGIVSNPWFDPSLIGYAYAQARSARFEHGESGPR